LAYEHAQQVIEGGALPDHVDVFNQSRQDVQDDILVFYELSKILRAQRFSAGALSINTIRLSFKLDNQGNPETCSTYDIKDSNRLIEEFMLLANISVANKIVGHFVDQSLLRRHEVPIEKRMNEFVLLAEKLGYPIDASSSGALQQSFERISSPQVQHVLKILAVKPMCRAKYICSGTMPVALYRHFALNVPLYTHFTSPIRRYADIVVHRLLQAALDGTSKFYLPQEEVQNIAVNCNLRRDAAKAAQDQSSNVFLSMHLHLTTLQTGRILTDAIVVDVKDRSFDVLLPEYGVEKRIYLDKLPLDKSVWHDKQMMQTLYWKRGLSIADLEEIEEQLEELDVIAEEEGQVFEDEEELLVELALDQVDHEILLDDAESNSTSDVDTSDNSEEAVKGEEETITPASTPIGIRRRKLSNASQASLSMTPKGNSFIELARRRSNSSLAVEHKQDIRVFDTVRVLISSDVKRSPPVINVIAVNPFMDKE
jgi:protein SSD1